MIVKLITVYVKPDHWDAYEASQNIWNRETAKADGYLGGFCGRANQHTGGGSNEGDNVAHLMFFWKSREHLERWMQTDHDRIAALARADEHYERIETRVLEPLDCEQPLTSFLDSGSPSPVVQLQYWSEAYRSTMALRTALRLWLFDHMAGGPLSTEQLANALGCDAVVLKHLLRALAAMGLVKCVGEGWTNTEITRMHLLIDAPAYQGDIILHNSHPATVQRTMRYGEHLGLPPDAEDNKFIFERFLRAMANTAAGGQAEALLGAIDLTECTTLLDIGGATGPYSIALCIAYPKLRARILDQAETIPLAEEAIRAAGLHDRIEVIAHDYRAGDFPGPVDVALLSNVLRGETPEMVVDILQRLTPALRVENEEAKSGRVIIHDHFPQEDDTSNVERSMSGLRAALFGLHLVDKSNYTMKEMATAVEQAGHRVVRADHLVNSIVMNGIIEAVPS